MVAMEASSSAHHWARKLLAMGLDARIISAQLVSPNRLGGHTGKNDANDAAAICDDAFCRRVCCSPLAAPLSECCRAGAPFAWGGCRPPAAGQRRPRWG